MQQTLKGLTEQEATARRAKGQGNNVRQKDSRTYGEILYQNTFTFLNSILFVIGAVLVALGLYVDALTSVGLVFLNVLIGISQEFRAKSKLDQIALLTRPTATVLREGVEKTVDPADIVLGDILVIHPGDQIVVDGQIVGDGKIDVDESLLTGESDLIPKSAGDHVLSGSFCVNGKAMYEAQKVGAESYANKLTESAKAFRLVKTPLQKDIDFVIRVLLLLAAMVGILFGVSFLVREVPATDSARMAAVVAGLVPNGLFFMIVAAYAMGALRMSGKGALIQQVNSVESMSNVNVLCLDKTGTLTANKINLNTVQSLGMDEKQVQKLVGHYVASQSASNRTSEAIAAVYKNEPLRVTDEVPFSSARKWSAVCFDDEAAKGIYVLGAPEILESYLKPDADINQAQIDEWAEQGLRVLLLAHHPSQQRLHDSLGQAGLTTGLEPLALLSFSDELRSEAKQTLENFLNAGIKLKIISGDNPRTVAALARQAGFSGDIKTVSGADLDQMDEDQFARAAGEATIFGRIRPEQKEKLVSSLRSKGAYVAMIGDGVNDVLSLKKAQIGIAMQSGSQATRGVADIILMGDSFAALPFAFTEGQRILNGMQDIVRLFLTRVFYMALLILGTAVIIDPAVFPLLPSHTSILTMVTVGIPTFALAAWARPGVVMRGQGSLIGSVTRFVLPASITIAAVGLIVYVFYMLPIDADMLATHTGVLNKARSALFLTLTLCGLVLIPFVEPPTPFWVAGDELSGDWRPTILALVMLAVTAAVFIIEPLRTFFGLTLLPLSEITFIIGLVVLWTFALRLIWRWRLFDRFLGFETDVA